jgi:hypothetical protein
MAGYWTTDLLQELGAHVHLAHALGNNWGNRRVKNDERRLDRCATTPWRGLSLAPHQRTVQSQSKTICS